MEKPIKDWGKGIPEYKETDLLEGMELRQAGISLPVIVLTSGTDCFDEIIDHLIEIARFRLF